MYGIVNLNSRQVEVYARPKGNGYESRAVFKAGQELPLVIDGTVVGSIAVADILP
jgi:Uma2 family endonuclease